MANRVKLTDRTVANAEPAPAGQRRKIADAVVPGLVLRITDRGSKTWVLWRRWDHAPNPSAKALGTYPAMSLAGAREKARGWLMQLDQGIDPRKTEAQARASEQERRTNTFEAVAEEFIRRHALKKRTGERTAREIRTELIPHWGPRPITEITRQDVVRLVEAIVDRPAPAYARNIYGHIQTLFNWAINRGIYGLQASPCDRLRPTQLIGQKIARQRVLNDDELRALWSAAAEMDYPCGPLIQMLMLTGARLNEVAEARWREFDLLQQRWVVPAARFKSDAEHRIPLTSDMVEVLNALPRWTGGDLLFTTTGGVKPTWPGSRLKRALNAAMASAPHWTFHDIRRTVRTRLSALRVPYEVAELIIGHAKRGLARVYDQHEYEEEMRAALEAWNARLRSIVSAPPPNVVSLAREVAS
jgi:integrase